MKDLRDLYVAHEPAKAVEAWPRSFKPCCGTAGATRALNWACGTEYQVPCYCPHNNVTPLPTYPHPIHVPTNASSLAPSLNLHHSCPNAKLPVITLSYSLYQPSLYTPVITLPFNLPSHLPLNPSDLPTL